jgi:NhaP-type Na+/H+ or K+/H+ antiporter
LFSDASTLPFRRSSSDISLPGRLLLIGLPLTLLLGGVVAKLLFPALPLGYAMLVAAILAPTDASLGLPIYNNPLVPVRIRRALNIESGLNDGLVSPFVLLFLSLTLSEEGVMLGSWFRLSVSQLALATVVGIGIGVLGGRFLRKTVGLGWTSHMWTRLSIISLALASYFLSVGIGGNGFVAAFVAGILFGHVSGHRLAEETDFTEASGTLLALMVWGVFGITLLSPTLLPYLLDWRVILYAVLSLTVIRMLAVAISLARSGLRKDTVAMMGWFGPRGLASAVFGLIAVGTFEESGLGVQPLAAIITLTILFSVFAHGFSAQPLARWYAARLEKAEPPLEELLETPEFSLRTHLPHL